MIALLLASTIGVTTRVSVATDGSQANGGTNGDSVGSENGVISADGRWVAFDSEADDLAPNDTNDAKDVFLRDLYGRTTICITAQGNLGSHDPAISANGRFVAFWSEATNLVPGDTNALGDVFVYDRTGGSIERESEDATGGYFPSISASGRFVAYEGIDGVHVRDRLLGSTEFIGVGSFPSISASGRWVGFEIINSQDFSQWKSMLYDRQGGTFEIESAGANSRSDRPAASADGRYVVFNSVATNLIAGQDLPPFVSRTYLRDRLLGTIQLVAESVGWNPVITPDGRFVAFDSTMTGPWQPGWNVFRLDRATGSVDLQSPGAKGGACFHPSISASGMNVVFFSYSNSLVPGDTNDVGDVFARRFDTAVSR